MLCPREEGRGTTVYDLLRGVPERVVTAGRLDRDSAGLLVLSDDGALVNRLTHPRFGHEKRYEVVAAGGFGHATLVALQGPMELDGYRLRSLMRDYCSDLDIWDSINWISSEVCTAWTEWQYAIEHWVDQPAAGK